MTTKSRRWWWMAIATTAVLVAGCGSGEEGGGARTAVLTMGQVRQVVPDAASMDGWKEAGKPNAGEMDDLQRQWACPMKGRVGCEGSRYFSASAFEQEGTAARVDYLVIAYDDEQLADAAYDVLWDGYYRKRVGQRAKAFDLGPLGDERDARWGRSGYVGVAPAAVTQARVGTTLLWVFASGDRQGDIDQDGVRDFTELLAERSRQAQNGDTPTAELGD
ncbi:hypothetical protein AB0D90_21475 [Streptomyces althioticus]|uniref:hypothetical protein n=1 Tax=Streptomyces althioticus TaxID=83380 RepID=UPI003404C205